MIAIKNISKTFHQKKQQFKALDNVSLEIQQGDIMGIIGFSGAGKSTLIRSVNLLEKPDEGKIIINGKDMMNLSSRELASERKKIGMIFQHFNLLSSRTVYDNVALPLELANADALHIKTKVSNLLKLVGLEDKADYYPASLSGGQKQRVAIARALANDPYLLLCDEATSALDPVTTESVLKLLKDINQQLGITILLITHEMDVIKSICKNVAVINKGQLVAVGPSDKIISHINQSIIHQFTIPKAMKIPPSLYNKIKSNPSEGLFPLIEIELNGIISFERILHTVYADYKVPHKLISADVEYYDTANFGRILIHLKGSADENSKAIHFFNRNNIKNTIKGYA